MAGWLAVAVAGARCLGPEYEVPTLEVVSQWFPPLLAYADQTPSFGV
jgi:hypothetical protein